MDVPKVNRDYFQRLSDPKSNYPQLYLYSEDDTLCPAKFIEEWAEKEQKRVVVWKKKWSNSKHVQHFRLHKEEYSKEVQQFVKFCESHKSSKL
jgi:hypothetical protein